ncbi:MAG TPA: MFS transporter, partial [Ktedonobacteraceae bacterium]|nr:MFS transporter [Ktedonobacteraceae bacterium]
MQPIDTKSRQLAMPVALIGKEQQASAQASGLLRTFSALRHRNYRLFFFGQMISQIGTWMQTTAQAWLV